MPRFTHVPLLFALSTLSALCASANDNAPLKFDFGPGKVAEGYTQVTPDMLFTPERGFGFEPGSPITGVDRGRPDPLRSDFVTADHPFHFTARVPHEGNYRVTITLGDADGESTTTIKAELRRLMVEKLHTARGEFKTVDFIVNVRTPNIAAVDNIKP